MPATEDIITRLLHDLDPMGTGCAHPDSGAEDEYASEARQIALQIDEGVPLESALIQTFDAWFWPGCLQEPQRRPGLDEITAAIEAGLQDRENAPRHVV